MAVPLHPDTKIRTVPKINFYNAHPNLVASTHSKVIACHESLDGLLKLQAICTRPSRPRFSSGVGLILFPVKGLELLLFKLDDGEVKSEKKEECHEDFEMSISKQYTRYPRHKRLWLGRPRDSSATLGEPAHSK